MGRRLAFGLLVAVLAAGAVVVAPRAFVGDAAAGDPKVADSLFKSGKQALGKGDAAGAISFFKKAQEENPDLIEACWWCASAQEKAGDKAAALATYREYLTLFGGKPAATKEEQRLKGLAEKSVAQLAAGESEFKKLEDGYVAALLAFAKDNFVRDPGVSRKAVDALLAVRPDDEEGKKLLEKLGGSAPGDDAAAPASASAPAPAVGPFKEVKEWRDLLAEQVFTSKDLIRYADGVMTFGSDDGSVVSARESLEFGTTFAYEMDFRITEVKSRGWLTGLCFAGKGSGDSKAFMCAFVNEARVSLMSAQGRASMDDVAIHEMPALDLKPWHRLGVVVRGPEAEVWWEGKKVLTWREPSGADLTGQLEIFQQRCATERRLFRAGKLAP